MSTGSHTGRSVRRVCPLPHVRLQVVVPRPVSTRPASRPDPPHRLPPDSVFLPRATDNDSEDVIDTPTGAWACEWAGGLLVLLLVYSKGGTGRRQCCWRHPGACAHGARRGGITSPAAAKQAGSVRQCSPGPACTGPNKVHKKGMRPIITQAVHTGELTIPMSCPYPLLTPCVHAGMRGHTAVRERQVRRDWNRVVRKERFRQLVGRDDPRVAAGAAGLGRALDDVLGVLMAHKDQLRAAFTYYSMQGGLMHGRAGGSCLRFCARGRKPETSPWLAAQHNVRYSACRLIGFSCLQSHCATARIAPSTLADALRCVLQAPAWATHASPWGTTSGAPS